MCLGLSNRNVYNYPFQFVPPDMGLFSSQTNFLVLQTIDTQRNHPQVCIEPLQYFSCIVTSPPCDVGSDLPLRICQDSCLAFNMLMSGTTCDNFYQDIQLQGFDVVLSFGSLYSLYLQFDCSDPSTYFFGNETVFFDGNCTNLFSAELQGLFDYEHVHYYVFNMVYRFKQLVS